MAKWQKRFFHGVAAILVMGMAGSGVLFYQATQGPFVRQQVMQQLRKHFTGADVALGYARLRLLGGISIDNLTLYRRDDPTRTPILHVPSGVIYHDKERLAQGAFAIRKMKLHQPRFFVSRSRQGQWNLRNILGPVHPEIAIPILEIEQGTMVIDLHLPDQEPNRPAGDSPLRVEYRDIHATLLNHPLPILNYKFQGQLVGHGPMNLEGTWHRTRARLEGSLNLAPMDIDRTLLQEFARVAPEIAEQVQDLSGKVHLHVNAIYQDGPEPILRHQMRAEIVQGRLVHRALPFPLEDLEIQARCDNGKVAIDRLQARSGPTQFQLKAQFEDWFHSPPPHASPASNSIVRVKAESSPIAPSPMLPGLDLIRTLELSIHRLPVVLTLFDRLPPSFRAIQQRFDPRGPLDLFVNFDRQAGNWDLRVRLKPEGMTARYETLPYPIREIRGGVDMVMRQNQDPQFEIDLIGQGNDRSTVTVRGQLIPQGPRYEFTVQADALPIDEPLLQALPAKFQKLARSYHPRGQCDVTTRISRTETAPEASQSYSVQFRDAAVLYDGFPYPLEQVSGRLDFRLGPGAAPNSTAKKADWFFTFNEIRAVHAGGKVQINGSALPTDQGNLIRLNIAGQRVGLDEDLAVAFDRMNLRSVWEMFAPSGRFDFAAEVAHLDSEYGLPQYDVYVTSRGARIQPTFFPLALDDLSGAFRLTRGRLEIEPFQARHGASRFTLAGGSVQIYPGGYHADLASLQAAPLPFDAALVRALPPALQSVTRALKPSGTVGVDIPRLVISAPPVIPGPPKPPVIYWDGRLLLRDVGMNTGVSWKNMAGEIACQGRYRGQVLEGVKGHIALDRALIFDQPLVNLHADTWIVPDSPNEIQLRHIHGSLFGGQIGGEAHVAFGSGLEYQVDLKAVQVRLEEFGRHNKLGGDQLHGLAKVELFLSSKGEGIAELEGGGNLHIPKGRMYNLPLILDLLKVPALRVPDGTAFEEAHAEFKIHGQRVKVDRLDLLGNAVSLGGRGEMNIDGSDLKMDFYAVWGHIVQMLPAGLRDIPPWLSKNLLKIHASGQLSGKLDIRSEPVPMLVDPVRNLVELARERKPKPPGPPLMRARGDN